MKFRRFILALLVLALSVSFLAVTASAASKKPAAPVVKATNVASSGEIKLSWDAVDGAKNYKIYRSASKNGTYKAIKTTTSTSFTNTAADPGDTYWYYVKAVSSNGTASKASNKVSATCKLARPVVTLSNSVYSGKVSVSWSPIEGAASYKVYRATSKNGEYKLVKQGTSTSFTNSSTEAGKTYYYKVKAIATKAAANSAYSAVKSRTCDLARPVIKLSNVTSSGKIKITWDAVDGAVSYKVYRSTDQKNWSLLKTTSNTSFTNTGAKAGTVYYYRVKAIASKSAANSAYSAAQFRTCDLARPVLTVSNDDATGRVKLSWSASEGAVEYKVYRSTSKNSGYSWIKRTTETSYTDISAEGGKTYYYKILAIHSNTDANSAYSVVKTGVYEYKTALEVSIALNEDGKPRLTWNEIGGAEKYRVYRSMSKNGTYKLISTTSYTSLTNGGAASGVTYYYKVVAIDSAGKEICESANIVNITTTLPDGETLQSYYVVLPQASLFTLPDSGSDTITLPYMTEVKLGLAVTSSDDGKWYRAFYQDKLYYFWDAADEDKLTTKKSSFQYTGNTEFQQQVVDEAMYVCQEWKTYYEHGESNGIPNAEGKYGFDCSGFVKYILNKVMIPTVPTYKLTDNITNLHATTSIYNAGYPGEFCAYDVDLADIQPGDIVFFSQETPNDHCGIYLGNGEFVHSSNYWENSVCVMPLTGYYLETLSVVRRYLPNEVTPANTAVTIGTTCHMYDELRAEEDARLMKLTSGTTVTVLYTNSDNWAYIRAEDGTLGFVLTRNFA